MKRITKGHGEKDYQITTSINDTYQEIVKKKKLFPSMYHFWALGLVYGILHNKEDTRSKNADLIRIQQVTDETVRDVIDICYNVLDDGKEEERSIFNKMLSHADAGIAELTKIYEKNGSFILPVVLEDAKEIWAKRVKEQHNINLEDL